MSPTKKVSTPKEDRQRVCTNSEHMPPMHMVFPVGRYEHTCPGCGKVTTFTVNRPLL